MAAGLALGLAMVLQAEQGGGRSGAAPAGTGGALIGGTLAPAKPDARGWGWQVKASINPATPRPFYNKAKELLFQDKQITSYTIATYNPEFYCEVAGHYNYIWFEMQHSTMSYDEDRRVMGEHRRRAVVDLDAARCPQDAAAAPVLPSQIRSRSSGCQAACRPAAASRGAVRDIQELIPKERSSCLSNAGRFS